jgi:PAS domain S-box-containing protein
MVSSRIDNPTQAGEQRYLRLFENLPICIFVADLTATPTVIREVNRRAELDYGYTAAELVGLPATDLVPEQSRASFQDIVQRALRGETVTAETTSRRRDGTTFPARVLARVDPNSRGHLVLAVVDITAEKQRRSEAQAIDAERLRIAHEIHDGVAQSLAAIRFKAALWSAETVSPELRTGLDELQAVLLTAIEDLRCAIFALHPANLDAQGFVPALTQLVDGFGQIGQLTARLEVHGPSHCLSAHYQMPLYRIVQQGLHNVRQHARARSVRVRLVVDPAGGVSVSLQDDGCGFDPGLGGTAGQQGQGHFGLRHMRERVLDLGGTLDIQSAPGQGTELLVTLPPLAR